MNTKLEIIQQVFYCYENLRVYAQGTMYKIKKAFYFVPSLIGVLILFGLIQSCTIDNPPIVGTPPSPIIPSPVFPIPDPEPDPSPLPSTPEEIEQAVLSYLEAQLDKEQVKTVPNFYYSLRIKDIDVAEERNKFWQLWKDVNKDRIKKNQFENITAEPKEVIWDIPAGQRMKAKLFVKGDKPVSGYPLFINLHGGGRADVQTPWGSIFNNIAWEGEEERSKIYKDAPSLYFVPRMADDRIGRWYLEPQRVAFRRVIQLGVLSGLVDPERIYILGTSEGGYGSHRLALFMPDFFAGAGPMAAAEPLGAAENLRNIAFGLQMGENDKDFNRSLFAHEWKDKLDELQKLNPSDFIHRIEIEPGKGHGDINFSVMTPWLSGNKRRIIPERISFLYYNMTSDYAEESYAQSAYYLDFRKLKHTKNASMFFICEKKGNDLYINSKMQSGIKVWGNLGIYLEDIDTNKPVRVFHNGTEVFNNIVDANKGAMMESLALWGDPMRIFSRKIEFLII